MRKPKIMTHLPQAGRLDYVKQYSNTYELHCTGDAGGLNTTRTAILDVAFGNKDWAAFEKTAATRGKQ